MVEELLMQRMRFAKPRIVLKPLDMRPHNAKHPCWVCFRHGDEFVGKGRTPKIAYRMWLRYLPSPELMERFRRGEKAYG